MDELTPFEEFWRDTQPFLFEHGYQLRPRLRPGWIPSWVGTNKRDVECEDSIPSRHSITVDATRIADGKAVFIKRIAKDSQETLITRYLSDPGLRKNIRNHSVPVLDMLIGDGYDFLVMPQLRRFYSPPFRYVEEVVDFVRQTLEGLAFLHDVGVAHRDCSDLNIMLDANSMYPDGFHPVSETQNRFLRGRAIYYDRADAPSPVTYYFTDFGISSHFKDQSKPRLVVGKKCQDKSVPELSNEVPYDPFMTDVYILGNVYRNLFTNVYSNLSFLLPLVTEMTRPEPHRRPSTEDALALFSRLVQEQSSLSLRWVLMENGLTTSDRRQRNLQSLKRLCRQIIYRILVSPLKLFALAATTATFFVYGPRAILIRIRNAFQRSSR